MSRWSELRRALAHAVAAGSGHSQLTEALTVALAVRARTADDADIRLLVEATVVPEGSATDVELERVTQALVTPAVRRWLGAHDLDDLPDRLLGARSALEAGVQPELEALGVRLLRVDVVAVEHLLASPSAPPAAPPSTRPEEEVG